MSEPVYKKPPLGLRPKWVVNELRIDEILGAMKRYSDEGYIIPKEWVEELTELVNTVREYSTPERSIIYKQGLYLLGGAIPSPDKFTKEVIVCDLAVGDRFKYGASIYYYTGRTDSGRARAIVAIDIDDFSTLDLDEVVFMEE